MTNRHQALPVRFFKCLIRTAKSCYASTTSGGTSMNENTRRDNGKSPERRISSLPPISMAHRDVFKIWGLPRYIPGHGCSPIQKIDPQAQIRKIVRDPGEIEIHYASYKPRGTSRKSTQRTKTTNTKDGGKISAYDSRCRPRKPIHRRDKFSRFLRAARNGFAPSTIITSDDLTIENTDRKKGKGPERRIPPLTRNSRRPQA